MNKPVTPNSEINDLINTIPNGIYMVDKKGNIVSWNNEMTNITGFSNSDLKKISEVKFYKEENSNNPVEFYECLKEHNEIQTNLYIETKENEHKLVYINAKIINDKNVPQIHVIVSISDISKIKACDTMAKLDDIGDKSSFHNIIGKDSKMKEIYTMIKMASETLSNVLVTGESGTGKELVARAIHELSDRKNKPFITVNCSALSETLLESELFGHIKGAFTGAYKDKIGKFEAAHGGTVFLDEIGDITPFLQVKLLRVIQEKTIVRVGDNKENKVDMRIITATNKDLRKLVNSGIFRDDLYYRLKVFQIQTVSLRERPNDIPFLCNHFIKLFNKKTGKTIKSFSEDAFRLLMEYCWPGNVRELENAIEHAYVVCTSNIIDIFDLPQEIRIASLQQGICTKLDAGSFPNNSTILYPGSNPQASTVPSGTKKARNTISKSDLTELLEKNNWNKTETARQLGISRVALWKKLKKFGFE